jgi:hypothetical protein
MPSKWTYQGKNKIFESPDGGKTVFEREIGKPHNTRKQIRHPQELLTKKLLPIDVFYKLFGKKHES